MVLLTGRPEPNFISDPEMDYKTIVACSTSILTIAAFVAQAVKIWRAWSMRDILLGMYLILYADIDFRVVYRILPSDPALILNNESHSTAPVSFRI